MLRVLVAVVLVCAVPAAAEETDPDTEVAQRLFAEGAAFYDGKDYAHALEKFEAARRVKPLPAFDYNIARCHDRLGQAEPAIAAYERYLAAAPAALTPGVVIGNCCGASAPAFDAYVEWMMVCQ